MLVKDKYAFFEQDIWNFTAIFLLTQQDECFVHANCDFFVQRFTSRCTLLIPSLCSAVSFVSCTIILVRCSAVRYNLNLNDIFEQSL